MNISMVMYKQIPPLSISPQEQPPPGKSIQNSSEQKETTHSNYHRSRNRDKTHFVACGSSCIETSPRMQTCRSNPETVSSGNSHQKCGPPYRQERVMSYSPPATTESSISVAKLVFRYLIDGDSTKDRRTRTRPETQGYQTEHTIQLSPLSPLLARHAPTTGHQSSVWDHVLQMAVKTQIKRIENGAVGGLQEEGNGIINDARSPYLTNPKG